jgi:hypothetical protein
MVMRQDQARAAVSRGVGDNVADRQIGAVHAAVMASEVKASRLVVDMRDPEMLLGRIGFGQAAGEEAACLLESVEMQRGFGTLMEHGANLCESGPASDFNLVGFGYPIRR